jgi:hypothetical protein
MREGKADSILDGDWQAKGKAFKKSFGKCSAALPEGKFASADVDEIARKPE